MCMECNPQTTGDAPDPRSFVGGGTPVQAGYDPSVDQAATTLKAPMPEVPSAIMLQNEANDKLSKAVEILHDRTSGLRSSSPEREPENRAVRDYGSETARNIADQAHRTYLAAQVIEKILTEMEI